MGETIVLYPCPGIGHLVSMVELGKLILTHRPSLSIIIFMSDAPYSTGSTAPYITHISATTPSITFHQLPAVSLPPFNSSTPMEELGFEIPRLNSPDVHQALQTVSRESSLKAFIIDFFCTAALQVSSSLGIPTYYFYTSGASALCSFLYLPTLHDTMTESFADANCYIEIPGMPPIYSSDMTEPWLRRESMTYKQFLHCTIEMPEASGILVNTYEALEPRAVEALKQSLCTPTRTTPPVYCVGPLIASSFHEGSGSGVREHECFSWLNSQPSKSVVFLSFGSRGTFQADQLKEIALGLETSGLRFLWVVKSPPIHDDEAKPFKPTPEPDLDALLPQGFLEKTKDRGLVVKSWAPQLAVLNHDAVGGFVTHCGWNSILEAVCAGVPMVAWPLYAEQRENRTVLVEELKLALPLAESKNGFVTANELEKRVRELMDPVKGKTVRDQVMVMRHHAEAALQEGGSSNAATRELLAKWQ